MKIINNEIRPVGYVTFELSEAEIQSIIGTMEQLQMLRNQPYGEMKGIRGDLYQMFTKVLTKHNKQYMEICTCDDSSPLPCTCPIHCK